MEDRSDRSAGSGGKITVDGGIGTIVIAVLLFLFSGDDSNSATGILGGGQAANYRIENVALDEYIEEKKFSAVVFGHLKDYWNGALEVEQTTYQDPKLVLFIGSVQSACRNAISRVGPFYCPANQGTYPDPSFTIELPQKYGASRDFVMAYIITHEVGHYVQNELGIIQQLDKVCQQVSGKEYNQYSARLELQADHLVDTFVKYLQGKTYNGQLALEAGDTKETITAANAIGDDTLQKEYQEYAIPDSFTHGTLKQ